jgi:lactate racemase
VVPESTLEKRRIMVVAMVTPARLVHGGDAFANYRRRAMRSRRPAIAGVQPMSNPRVVAVVAATARRGSLASPFGNARGASSRAASRTRTRGAASLDAASVVPDADPPKRKHIHPPAVYVSEPGEEVLMQFGESMRVEELPAGTRVAYPGVRANAPSDPKTMRAMVEHALDNPIGQPPLREKIRRLLKAKSRPKILFAFDDVSIPLPPMVSPDIRSVILEEAERRCVEEGVDPRDVKFVCSIALHRYIREEEFRHVCGAKLFRKYYGKGQMTNWNAVDREFSVEIGVTSEGEKVRVANEFAEADLMVYANVNYVAMDGGYKSYATGLVHYDTLAYNHDSSTLKRTRSLFDPPRSALHKSIVRIGKVMQKHTDVFHVETVLDDNRFPWYLSWVQIAWRRMGFLRQLVAKISCFFLKFLPNWLRLWIFWGPLVRGPFGLVQVVAGETEAVHEETLRANYEDSVVDVDGQADVLVLAPTCIGPYTKDTYLNPLLVNTYALGYYYNMYVGGVPLLKQGGVMVVVNPMPYKWTSPTHDAYRAIFEEAVGPLGPERFEELQARFATDDKLNDIYRNGLGPAAVHGFYMYTWAAHGMEKVGKVFVVGATDDRGPNALGWEKCDSVVEAVAAARAWLDNPDAKATFWQCPPVGYARVAVAGGERERARIAAESECPKAKAKRKALLREAELAEKKKAEENATRAMLARAEEAKRSAEARAKEAEASVANKKIRRDAVGLNASDAAKAQAERATAGALANARMTAPRGLASRREERDMWLGAVTVPPAHLDGSMPGDAGFDPLGLGVDPKRLAWYQEAELMHGRWAMAAVVGVVAAEAAGAAPWWSAGGAASYALPANALLAIQFAVMGVLELKRVNGFIATGESGAWSSFPFDPLGLQKDATRVAEVKHGRLGMLAFAGIVAQAVVYRVGPLLALRDHVEDPFGCNLVSNVAHIGQTFEAVASKM